MRHDIGLEPQNDLEPGIAALGLALLQRWVDQVDGKVLVETEVHSDLKRLKSTLVDMHRNAVLGANFGEGLLLKGNDLVA